jgi:hypothetical protein
LKESKCVRIKKFDNYVSKSRYCPVYDEVFVVTSHAQNIIMFGEVQICEVKLPGGDNRLDEIDYYRERTILYKRKDKKQEEEDEDPGAISHEGYHVAVDLEFNETNK